MSKLALLAGAGAGALMVLYVFMRWDRSGREHWVVYLVLSLLVTESVLYSNQTGIPRSVWHPGSGSFQFRLPEVLITLGILARLLTKGRPRRIGLPALLWLAVAAWWAVEAVEGVIRGNNTTQLPYEAKAIVYVMGAYALASGIPLRQFFEGRGFPRLFRWSALAAAVLIVLDFTKKTVSFNVPLLAPRDPQAAFGVMGTDAASIFVAIGVIGFLLELSKERRSRLNMYCAVPLLLSPFFAFQRAVLLSLGAMVALVVVVGMGSMARERLRVRAGEVAVVALALVGVVLGVSVIPAITTGSSVTQPVVGTISRTVGTTFTSQAKAESAQSRINKWTVALGDARKNPFLGQGLGFEYTYYMSGQNQFVTTDLTENILLDLWLRTGLLGLALFLVALIMSAVNGFAAWRLHPDPTVAVLALALLAVVVGLIATGQVESIFENYRLATVLGLSLGMLRSAVTSAGTGLQEMRSYRQFRQYEVV